MSLKTLKYSKAIISNSRCLKWLNKSMAGKPADWTIKCGKPKGSARGGALEVAIEEYLNRRFDNLQSDMKKLNREFNDKKRLLFSK